MSSALLLWVKIGIAAMAAWVIALPIVIWLLLGMQVLDIVSGLVASGQRSELSSSISWEGMKKKVFQWILVLTAVILQYQVGMVFGQDTHFIGLSPAEVAAWFFVVTEALSIAENADKAGMPMPPFMMKALAIANDKYKDSSSFSTEVKDEE